MDPIRNVLRSERELTYEVGWEDMLRLIGDERLEDPGAWVKIRIADATFLTSVFPIRIFVTVEEDAGGAR